MKLAAPFNAEEMHTLRRTTDLPLCPQKDEARHAFHLPWRRRGELAVTSVGLICHTCGNTTTTVTVKEDH